MIGTPPKKKLAWEGEGAYRMGHYIPKLAGTTHRALVRHYEKDSSPMYRAVLNAKKKQNPVQSGVISKEPADSTCLHPGVPNC